jgi:hypothetical protein
VRAALTAVHKAIFTDPSNFTQEGFLTIGFAGHQPELGDWYSNSGSMYITSEGLLGSACPPPIHFGQRPLKLGRRKKRFKT